MASAMLLTSCDDQIMEWGRPAGEGEVTTAEIPLAVKEVLANYEPIKTYAAQYTPNMVVGLGFSAAMYNESASTGTAYKTLPMRTSRCSLRAMPLRWTLSLATAAL